MTQNASSQPNSSTQQGAAQKTSSVTGLVGLGKEFYARFNADECAMRANALSFIAVLSIVPVLLFALAILGFVIPNPQEAAAYVQRFIEQLLPGQQATQAASDLIDKMHIVQSAQTLMRGKWYAVILGFGSLLWAALSLFASAITPMNAAWSAPETRSFLQQRVVCLKALVGAGVLFIVSIIVSTGTHGLLKWLGVPQNIPFVFAVLLNLLTFVIAVGLNTLMFATIYRLLPDTDVSLRAAAFGGLITGILWEVFKEAFSLYLVHFGNFNKLYGALGGIFLLVTWISYSCLILLAGAIIAAMYHEHKELAGILPRKP